MLVHRLRRWPNSKPALGQRVILAGYGQSYFWLIDYNLVRETNAPRIKTEN